MGAWGVKTFENDTSLDWVADFEAEGADALHDALEDVADADSDAEIDADEACCALAAAEIVAAIKTGDQSRLGEEARAALATYRDDIDSDALTPIAARAADRIKTAFCEQFSRSNNQKFFGIQQSAPYMYKTDIGHSQFNRPAFLVN